jgi:hypothetical protein
MTANLDLSTLRARKLRAWWYDPRAGIGTLIGAFDASIKEFQTPSYGPDWVLVVDDEDAGYPPPGLNPWHP